MNTNPPARFTGEVAFITGAGNGIGRATAIEFARQGGRHVPATPLVTLRSDGIHTESVGSNPLIRRSADRLAQMS